MSDVPGEPPFDDAVLRAMARWPDVPQCFGWLGLDRRGNWRIRGELVSHTGAIAFLGRHYRADARGRWYVQNGPQQAFVDLDYTPWIFRRDPARGFVSHTGRASGALHGVLLDDEGNLLLETALGLGLLDDRDLTAVAELLEWDGGRAHALRWEERRLPVVSITRAAVPARGGFDPHPQADAS